MITLDFETEAIVGNPIVNPPKPVGLAVWVPDQDPVYLAWGHPTENNCTWEKGLKYARTILRDTDYPILFHNAPFDLAVLNGSLGTTWHYSDWPRIHDTQYLAFLADPYASTLSLKPSAARYLDMPPDEQDELKAWILSHVPEATDKTWGGYICRAPGDLVGRYAIGDVVRTRRLFDYLHPRIVERGMQEAYDRERELMPILYESSRRGIKIDRDTMEHHHAVYTKALDIADTRIRDRLGRSDLDFDKRGQLAEALDHSGLVTEWSYTPTGKKSTSKKTLRINEPEIADLVSYRGALHTCLSTFMGPWLELSRSDGRLHTSWNSVRTVERDSRGTQTGRLSSNGPNFQNVPTEFGLTVPDGLVPLPLMRQYLLPEDGHVWIKRDFSSQEIRILAHFEDGELCQAFRLNPDFDPHAKSAEEILVYTGRQYNRKQTKIVAFGIIYGSGVPGLMGQLKNEDYNEVSEFKRAWLDLNPGVRDLQRGVSNVGRRGDYIRTWGGRQYYAEPSKVVDGRMRSFEYKLLNYLIQGSAADQTKQSIIDWNDARRHDAVFLATVHDEINVSCPAEEWERHMRDLRVAMNKDRFDVPFKSEGFKGPSWQELEGVE
jgi:DNA polymerase I-like protein with 3'-5' exonuclease and polymerase domains